MRTSVKVKIQEGLVQLVEDLTKLYQLEKDDTQKDRISELIQLAYHIYQQFEESDKSITSKLIKKLLEKIVENGADEIIETISERIGDILS